jgi:hypothetical protein
MTAPAGERLSRVITIRTARCELCGHDAWMLVDVNAYRRWKSGVRLERAFPRMPADIIKLLRCGIHASCARKDRILAKVILESRITTDDVDKWLRTVAKEGGKR